MILSMKAIFSKSKPKISFRANIWNVQSKFLEAKLLNLSICKFNVSLFQICKPHITQKQLSPGGHQKPTFTRDTEADINLQKVSRSIIDERSLDAEIADLVKFIMCTLVSREYLSLYKYIKRHVYPVNQGTYDKLNQNRIRYICYLVAITSYQQNSRLSHTLI